jgi:hypothetical protein
MAAPVRRLPCQFAAALGLELGLQLGGEIWPMLLDFQPERQPPGAGSHFNRQILKPIGLLRELVELRADLLNCQGPTDVFEGEGALGVGISFFGHGQFWGECGAEVNAPNSDHRLSSEADTQ